MSVEISFPSILRVAFRIHQVLCDSCTAETVRSGVKTRAPWSWVGGDPNLALPRCQTSFRPVSGFSICPLSVKPTLAAEPDRSCFGYPVEIWVIRNGCFEWI